MGTLVITDGAYVAGASGFGEVLSAGTAAAANQVPTNGTFTAEARIKIASAPSGLQVFMGTPFMFWLAVNASGFVQANYGQAGTAVSLFGTTNIANNAWHHVALVLSGTGAKLFVDGVQQATSTTTYVTAGGSTTPANPFGVRYLSSAAGTFDFTGQIEEVTIFSNAKYSAGFTAPTASYVGNEAGLVALWRLDGNGEDSKSVGGIPPNSAEIVYSQMNWKVSANSAQTVNPGAWLKTIFSGATCTLNFDVSSLTTPLPQIWYQIDGQTWQQATIAATVALTMPTNTDNTKHLLEVWIKATTIAGNRWSTLTSSVTFKGFTLADGGALFSQDARDFGLFYGDSITEGILALRGGDSNEPDRSDSKGAFSAKVAELLGVDYSAVGFGGTSFTLVGPSGLPKFSGSYSFLWSGESRNFANTRLKFIAIMIGTNDFNNDLRADCTAALNGLIAATSVRIFLIRPFKDSVQQGNLLQAIAACNNPSQVVYIDTAGFWSAADSSDNIHPYAYAAQEFVAPKIAALMRPYLQRRYITLAIEP